MRLVERGMTVLAKRRAQSDGETVTYGRPGVVAGRALSAVCGFPKHEVDVSLNMPVRVESRKSDFFVRAETFAETFAEPALSGMKPEKGDWIDRTLGGRSVRYVVISDKSQPAFEYADPEQLVYRIHTRLMLGLPAGGS